MEPTGVASLVPASDVDVIIIGAGAAGMMCAMTAASLDISSELLILYVIVDYLLICTVEEVRQVGLVLFQLFTHLHGSPR